MSNLNNSSIAVSELPLSVQKCINNVIKEKAYETHEVNIKLISTEGGNYLAFLYEVDIKGIINREYKETNLFIKAAKPVELLKEVYSIEDVYLAEGYFYKELSKKFKELEDKFQIPQEERFNVVKCYQESDEKAIIFENLGKKGFKTLYRMDVPPLKFVELCIEQLAKFHAFSYILQKFDPEFYTEKICTRTTVTNYGDKWKELISHVAALFVKFCDGDLKKKVEAFVPVNLVKFPQYYKDTQSTICCMCHGDFRINNALVKEVGGEAAEVVMIDYQMIQFGCPVNDFLFFIYTSTDRKFRLQHLDHIKDVYHNTLGRFLKYFSINVEDVYPRKEFERVLNWKKDFPVMLGLTIFPAIFVKESDVPDFSKDDMSVLDCEIDDRGKRRFLEIAEDFWGYSSSQEVNTVST